MPYAARLRLVSLENRCLPAIYTVASIADTGPGTLREAVTLANGTGSPSADTIIFGSLFDSPQTITLKSSQILITDNLTILGPSGGVTINGDSTNRIFEIDGATFTKIAVNISDVTVTNGRAYSGDVGGGIKNNGDTVTLTRCTITNCLASQSGGGIASFGGSVNIFDSTLHGNTTTAGSGGSVYFGMGVGSFYGSALTLTRCTVSESRSTYSGGGIFAGVDRLIIVDSTLSASSSTFGGGGALHVTGQFLAEIAIVRNTTISGNSAHSGGGGIYFGSSVRVQTSVENCTITANTTGSNGGGILNYDNKLNIESSIIAGNVSSARHNDISSNSTVNTNYCAIGEPSGFNFYGRNNLPMVADLAFGPLADNGGPTFTHALLPGSPCIDSGSNAVMSIYDQRGNPFVREFSTGEPDIGAYEFRPGAKISNVQVNDDSPQRSRVTNITVEFDSVITLPANMADAFQLKRQSDNAVVELNASANGNAVTLTFTGGTVEFGSLADGRYTLTVLASQVNGGLFDGDGDGGAGDSFVLVGSPSNKLFRLFGDANGDGRVDLLDFASFRAAYGSTSSIFSFDGLGPVDLADFGQFAARFGQTI